MSKIITGKNPRKPFTVRYWEGGSGRQREKSFATARLAQVFKAETDNAEHYHRALAARADLYRNRDPFALARFSGPGPIEIPVRGILYAIYRLWDAAGGCLYVGKSAQVHPILRAMSHRDKDWWPEVDSADFVTVLPENLDQAEFDQIRDLNPRHNQVRRRWAG